MEKEIIPFGLTPQQWDDIRMKAQADMINSEQSIISKEFKKKSKHDKSLAFSYSK